MPLRNTCRGFTLLEVLMAVALMGLLVSGVAHVFQSGLQALDVQAEHMLLESHLRSRMERLVATPFDSLAGGNETVSVRGTDFTITWSVANTDLDGDSSPEATAKQITVTVTEAPAKTLTLIVADSEGDVKKL